MHGENEALSLVQFYGKAYTYGMISTFLAKPSCPTLPLVYDKWKLKVIVVQGTCTYSIDDFTVAFTISHLEEVLPVT